MSMLYLDCVAGLAGDMMLGLLLDLGAPFEEVRRQLATLPLADYELRADSVLKQGIAATQLQVIIGGDPEAAHHAHPHIHHDEPDEAAAHAHDHHAHDHHHEHEHEHEHEHHHHGASLHLADIDAMIRDSGITAAAKDRARRIFRMLGEAEAHVHGVPVDHVHFHEVGAVDSIVDIVGTAIGLDLLGVTDVQASHIPVGHGTVHVAHGHMPVPAPATAELLRGIPTYDPGIAAEMVTPTGAAILKALATEFGAQPAMITERVGYGAGSRDFAPLPNVVRGLLGTRVDAAPAGDSIVVVETNVDDMLPEHLGYVFERLLAVGAVDVFFTPVQGKKNRPATLVTVLVHDDALAEVQRVLFAETTTFGLRMRREERVILQREMLSVDTAWGAVAVKVGRRNGAILTVAPEYEECKQLAQTAHEPLRAVYEAAKRAAHARLEGEV